MGEAKRRHSARNHVAEGTHTFSNDAEAFDLMVHHLLEKTDDINVVIGPVVRAPIGMDAPDYFVVATSEKNRGFRCDQISIGEGYTGETMRALCGSLLRLELGRSPHPEISDMRSKIFKVRYSL
jgi:hypothetical protein